MEPHERTRQTIPLPEGITLRSDASGSNGPPAGTVLELEEADDSGALAAIRAVRSLREARLQVLSIGLGAPWASREAAAAAAARVQAERMLQAVNALRDAKLATCRVGLLGSYTTAAVALIAAALRPGSVAAVVSNHGMLGLADRYLPDVGAPTLLVVGGSDLVAVDDNLRARSVMTSETRVEVVTESLHPLEEPETPDIVPQLVVEWFERHLAIS